MALVTESLTPRPNTKTEIRFQPSMLSVPSAAATVAPEDQAPTSAQQAPIRRARRKLWFFAALAGLAGAFGVSALHRPAPILSHVHSGSPGYRQSSTGHDLHWGRPALTVYLDGSLAQLGPGANEAVMQAFGQWVGNDHRLPALSFDTGKTSPTPVQDGKSTVSYGRITHPGHEHDLAITVTYANDQTGEIIEADIILNSLYPMGVLTPMAAAQAVTVAATTGTTSKGNGDGNGNGNGNNNKNSGVSSTSKSMTTEEAVDCNNRYDAQNVATHEAGHFFGLGEDPIKSNATMFQVIDQCETHKRALATTDVGALGTLYAESEDPDEAKAGARACSFGGVPQNGGALAVSSAIFGLMLLGRRRAR